MKMTFVQTVRQVPSALKHLIFTSDGCTMSPDLDYYHCCWKHDFRYFIGDPKLKADWELAKCIWTKGRWYHKVASPIYLSFVVLVGWIPYRTHRRNREKYAIQLQDLEIQLSCMGVGTRQISKRDIHKEFRKRGGWEQWQTRSQ